MVDATTVAELPPAKAFIASVQEAVKFATRAAPAKKSAKAAPAKNSSKAKAAPKVVTKTKASSASKRAAKKPAAKKARA